MKSRVHLTCIVVPGRCPVDSLSWRACRPPSADRAADAIPAATPVPARRRRALVKHDTAGLSIRLPNDWQVLDAQPGRPADAVRRFQKKNPDLAKIIGSADALQGVALWAFKRRGSGAAFVDNLNIRRSPLEGQKIDEMCRRCSTAVSGAVQARLGFEVKTTEADLNIGGQPAARIVYSFPWSARMAGRPPSPATSILSPQRPIFGS